MVDRGSSTSYMDRTSGPSEPRGGDALEFQALARLGGCRDVERQLGEDATDARHLLRIGARELAAAQIQAVFEPHAHVSAEQCIVRTHRHLMASGGEHRELD